MIDEKQKEYIKKQREKDKMERNQAIDRIKNAWNSQLICFHCKTKLNYDNAIIEDINELEVPYNELKSNSGYYRKRNQEIISMSDIEIKQKYQLMCLKDNSKKRFYFERILSEYNSSSDTNDFIEKFLEFIPEENKNLVLENLKHLLERKSKVFNTLSLDDFEK